MTYKERDGRGRKDNNWSQGRDNDRKRRGSDRDDNRRNERNENYGRGRVGGFNSGRRDGGDWKRRNDDDGSYGKRSGGFNDGRKPSFERENRFGDRDSRFGSRGAVRYGSRDRDGPRYGERRDFLKKDDFRFGRKFPDKNESRGDFRNRSDRDDRFDRPIKRDRFNDGGFKPQRDFRNDRFEKINRFEKNNKFEKNNRFEKNNEREERTDRSSDRFGKRNYDDRRNRETYSATNVRFDGIVNRKGGLYTINIVPGYRTKFDKIESMDGKEIRYFEPRRSKLASSIVKGLKNFAFKNDSTVLYLGASHGYTVSFLSDICRNGTVFCVDIAPRVMRDLVYICEVRKNLIPLLGDANDLNSFNYKIVPSVDIVFMDVAQRNQAEIFIKNCGEFLSKDGIGYLAVKSRAVDTTKDPQEIYAMVRSKINSSGFLSIIEEINLQPIHRDHLMFVVKKS